MLVTARRITPVHLSPRGENRDSQIREGGLTRIGTASAVVMTPGCPESVVRAESWQITHLGEKKTQPLGGAKEPSRSEGDIISWEGKMRGNGIMDHTIGSVHFRVSISNVDVGCTKSPHFEGGEAPAS